MAITALKRLKDVRPVHFLGYVTCGDWKVKMYGIAYKGEQPRKLLVRQAIKSFIPDSLSILPISHPSSRHHNIAFTIVHDGKDMDSVTTCWWEREHRLCGKRFTKEPKNNNSWFSGPLGNNVFAYTWEIPIFSYEAQEWLSHVVLNGKDTDGYMKQCLHQM
jgi:hypothetical protein